MGQATQTAASIAYLVRALKTPTIGRVWEQLADTAREEGWSHEDYLAAVLQRQVADREANGPRCGSAARTSRRSRPWKTSTSITSLRSDMVSSRIWPRRLGSRKRRTSSSLNLPESGRRTSASGWASKLVTQGSLSHSTRRRAGRRAYGPRINRAGLSRS